MEVAKRKDKGNDRLIITDISAVSNPGPYTILLMYSSLNVGLKDFEQLYQS